MTMDYQTTRELLASFAGPLTVWVGDTLPDLDIWLVYDDGGYVDLEPPTAISGQLDGPMNAVDDPVVFSLHAGQGALFPLATPPPATPYRVSIGSETLLVTLRAGDVFTADRAQEGTSIALHSDDSNVQLQVLTLVTVYVSRYKGTKLLTSAPCQILNSLQGHVALQSGYVFRTPGLYEGQVTIRYGTDPPGYDYLSSQKFLIHARARTPQA